ncbi:hypothetical protein F4820DRAFT_449294 [Hypoxylon rubiginosum]|uniref:Uncharacterized protein n=1 Tax=Hypoxylon rubiginosum TaxID=110542 RepID=A0ACB9YYC1_9PEZI|nr:hypothetical protein F4820DRAFT_449294 [Hypoxylon rubiginosum]
MKGSHIVFGVTNYWDRGDMQLEIQQDKNVADAAKPIPTLMGKAEVAEYMDDLGIPSYFMPDFYMSNLPGDMFKL